MTLPGRAAMLWALLLACPAAAAEVEPLVRLRVLGGQYFFKGERSSLGGDLSALVAPAVLLSDRWALLPALSAEYQGTKSVRDLVGAGSLFQQRMDHRASLKAVCAPEGSRWRLKPSVSFGVELLKETADEEWGRGLFDARRVVAGFEAEYVYRDPYSLRLSYDYGYVHFPNYRTLESAAAFDFQGQALARELVGERVLNAHINMASLALSAPLGARATLESTLSLRRLGFPNQRLVEESGALGARERADLATSGGVSLRMPFEPAPRVRLSASLSAGFTDTLSNQGSYDARNARYLPGFYDFWEAGGGPALILSLGDEREPVSLSLAGSLWRRSYPNRPAQDALGVYGAKTLRQDSWTVSAGLSYPMAPRLRLLLDVRAGRTTSNQDFEQVYSYRYGTADYRVGLAYEY